MDSTLHGRGRERIERSFSEPSRRAAARLLAAALTAATASAQAFENNTTQIPGGPPFNSSYTENVDFGDCDLDGDWDAAFADGGEAGNDQSRLWINLGGAQGGTLGFFGDQTHSRLPAVTASSRDIEFVDLENDGDPDLFLSNSSAITNQSNRWWINLGLAQGGAAGFYSDQTSTRWIDLGVNNGTTAHSSIAPGLVLASGGYVDWSCDSSFADLDADGDMDLVQASYGVAGSAHIPTRVFVNDGLGYFTEFNPSGFQLSNTDILNGSPGLWAEGIHQNASANATGQQCDISSLSVSVEIGDVDGDFDLDFINGDKFGEPRLFQNRLEENGGVLTSFRDVSHAAFAAGWAPGVGSYEQEFFDLDLDGDLDLYGINWSLTLCDSVVRGNGNGTFLPETAVGTSCERDNEADPLDFDNDGDMDVIAASDSGQEHLYRNLGAAGGFALVYDASLLPVDTTESVGADACDVDEDGDFDVFVGNYQNVGNTFLKNLTQTADTTAPRVPALEQVSDRAAGPAPTFVRAHVLDNAAWYLVAWSSVVLEFSVGGSPFSGTAMRWSGGQVFRGEIPGELAGTITYRVRATDEHGNAVVSATRSFNSTSVCAGGATIYCTSQVNSSGCTPAIAAAGFPSAAAGAGFFVIASQIVAKVNGIPFYSKTGPNAVPFGGGTLCILPPTIRMPVQNSAGTSGCTGTFGTDFNAWVAGGSDPALVAGQAVWIQYWSRDPASANQTNLTNAVSFSLCP